MEDLSIKKIQAGDEEELKDLFAALLPRVRYIAYKYSGRVDRELVDDIVQEAIVKIYSSLQKFDSNRGDFWLWCNAIVRNVAIDAIHSASSRSERFQTIEDTTSKDLPVAQPSVDTARLFNEAIQLLSEEQKVIVTLHMEGHSFSEIAQMLGEDHNSIRARYYRAIGKLKQLLLANAEGTNEEVGK